MGPRGPQNGIMGDDSFGTNLPETQVDSTALDVEKRMAKFSKSKEFQALKNHAEARIEFYQQYLPDGRPITDIPNTERGYMWLAANIVTGEFKAMLSAYEQAGAIVKEAAKRV